MIITTTVFITLLALFFLLYQLIFKNEKLIRSTKDKAILITGCDSGIGLELAKHFFFEHNFTLICCFFNRESHGYKELFELKDKEKNSNKILFTSLDITSTSDLSSLTSSLDTWIEKKVFKQLWAVVNNAGLMVYGEFDWFTKKQLEDQINVNVLGTIRMTQTVLPYIIESKGRIVNVSSVCDRFIFPGISVYAATKSAISFFSTIVNYEMRKFGCNVVTLRPGDFARFTDILSKHNENKDLMWNNMSEKKQKIYKEYFPSFNKSLVKNIGMTGPRSMAGSTLFSCFERAIMSISPSATITCAPLHFRLFYFLTGLMPIWIKYYVVDMIAKIGFRSLGVRAHLNLSDD